LQIPPRINHPPQPALISMRLLHLLRSSKRAPRRQPCLLGLHALAHVIRGEQIQMRPDLVIQRSVETSASKERRQP
jgi:hypothetical protein